MSRQSTSPVRGPVSLEAPGLDHVCLVASATRRGPWRLPPSEAAGRDVSAALAHHGRRLAVAGLVTEATVFEAVLAPPARSDRLLWNGFKPVRPDRVLLLTGRSPLDALESSIVAAAARRAGARQVAAYDARIVRQIGAVDRGRPGVFLFNYFHAATAADVVAVWEQTAQWFVDVTGLDNSTVFQPRAGSAAGPVVINHCRWDRLSQILPPLLLRPSFRREVLDAFDSAGVAAVPVLYRLAGRWRQGDRV